MVTRTEKVGRFGNQFIRNLAVSLIAEKHNLKVEYCSKDLLDQLGVTLFCGTNTYNTTQPLTDENYFTNYNCENLDYNLNPNDNFFQTKEITNLIYDYLHTDSIKSNIIEKNPFKEQYNANNNLFVHIRLTDVAQCNPGIDYYLNQIKNINFNKLYISTDDETHNIIKTLLHTYQDATLIHYDEITTFQFASTCKHIILSHGSFSGIIGYLSFFSNIYYPEYETGKIWYGDMFSIKNWVKCSTKE
jgi:hypothetical protein